jgi:hypothetical protein
MPEHISAILSQNPEYFDQMLSESDAAQFIGYSKRALQNWRLRGGGPNFIQVSSRSIRYRRGDLIEWASARVRSSTSNTRGRK